MALQRREHAGAAAAAPQPQTLVCRQPGAVCMADRHSQRLLTRLGGVQGLGRGAHLGAIVLFFCLVGLTGAHAGLPACAQAPGLRRGAAAQARRRAER